MEVRTPFIVGGGGDGPEGFLKVWDAGGPLCRVHINLQCTAHVRNLVSHRDRDREREREGGDRDTKIEQSSSLSVMVHTRTHAFNHEHRDGRIYQPPPINYPSRGGGRRGRRRRRRRKTNKSSTS